MRLSRLAVIAASACLLAAAAAAPGGPHGPASSGTGASVTAANLVTIRPDAVHAVPGALPVPPTTAFCEQHFHIACYQPAQLQQGYDLRRLYREGITGRGQTIIIVDPFGSPSLRRDLRTFGLERHL